ncbi:MAG: class I SAM-dependent methyltransferase [Sulfurovum sp.]|nr:class I SAM-dependent methyltransferase [Sulfurovum sp.]MDD3498938.1 class I SAM-dependent methyltransferase [Sulfurovum sp.]
MSKHPIYYDGTRAEIVDFLPKKYLKVLEIGCGKGGFRTNLSKNCEYWGVEPYVPSANTAKQKLDKVLVGTFEQMLSVLPDNYFDLVICNDVIEHMPDHHQFYKDIKSKCVHNAYMIGSLPNVRYIVNLYHLLVKKEWRYEEEGILDRTHLRFFTLKSIEADFIDAAFNIEALKGINKISSKNILQRLKIKLAEFFLGEDILYLQFAFRVKIK